MLDFPGILKKIQANPPKQMFASKQFTDNEMPSFVKNFFCALIPVLLMGFATIGEYFIPVSSQVFIILKFTSDSGISMLIALLVALVQAV